MPTLLANSATLLTYFYLECEPLPNQPANLPDWLTAFAAYWSDYWQLTPASPEAGDDLMIKRWGLDDGIGVQVVLSLAHRSVNDTVVLTLVRPLPGLVPDAWHQAHAEISSKLDEILTHGLAGPVMKAVVKAISGYSFLYVARTDSPVERLNPAWIEAASGGIARRPLAEAPYGSLRLWLLTKPNVAVNQLYNTDSTPQGAGQGQALQAKPRAFSSYIVLGLPDDLSPDQYRQLYLPDSLFFGPDSTAHKAYYQHHFLDQRSGQHTYRSTQERKVDDLFRNSGFLLKLLGKGDLNGSEPIIKKLASYYGDVADYFGFLTRLRITQERQALNMRGYIQAQANYGQAVWQYHLTSVDKYLEDIYLLVGKSKTALKSAETALLFAQQQQDRQKNELQKQHDNLQQQQDKENNKVQERRNILLAGLGLLLASMSILKGPVILAIYHRWAPRPLHPSIINFFGNSSDLHNFLAEFTVLIILILGVRISIWLYLRHKNKNSNKTA